jgi:hypothetical protein
MTSLTDLCDQFPNEQVGKVGETVLEGPDESIFFAAPAMSTVRHSL